MQAPKILFFDVNETLLDLAPLKKQIIQSFDVDEAFVTLWFTTMLQYSLVHTVTNDYKSFDEIGVAVMGMLLKVKNKEYSEDKIREIIVPVLLSLPPHEDVVESLQILKQKFKLIALTNSSQKGLETQITNAGLDSYFIDLLSVEQVGKFKPHTDVYHWAAKQNNCDAKDCMLIAAHAWDIKGASEANWQTAFVQRPGKLPYALQQKPSLHEKDVLSIAKKLTSH